MGGGIGVEDVDVITEEVCKDITGCNFDTALFGKLADKDGAITRDVLLKTISERVDVAFLHDVGSDADNALKMKINIINRTLLDMGLKTWLDDGVLDERSPAKRFKDGIDNAQCAVILLTSAYSERVGAESKINLAQEAFNYCADRKTNSRMVAVVLDEALLSTRLWKGEVGLVLGRKPFIDMTGDLTDGEYAHSQCELLYRNITQKVGKTVMQFTAELGQLMPDNMRSSSASASAREQQQLLQQRSGPSKPLQQLTVAEVSRLLTALNMSIYAEDAAAKLVDGECLLVVEHFEELKEMGISMTAKAKILFNRLTEFKVYGVPLAFLKEADNHHQQQKQQHGNRSDDALKSDVGRGGAAVSSSDSQAITGNSSSSSSNHTKQQQQVPDPPECDEVTVPSHQHSLRRCHKDSSWQCDGCNATIALQTAANVGTATSAGDKKRWRCSGSCDYDLCNKCVGLQLKA